MPQVDTVSSGCAGVVVTGYPNDSKIAALDDPPASDLPDFAPESFFLSKDAELDWLDRNAFIERKDSGKGGGSLPPSSSQKYSLSVKSKPSFIGLPKSQKAAYGEAKPRGRPPSIRLFPKRSQSSKSEAPMADPTSPKVSCIGRVRSRRERSLRKKKSQKQPDPAINRSMSIRSHKTGRFWTNLLSIFGSRGHKQAEDEETGGSKSKSKSKSLRTCNRRLKKSKSLKKQRNIAGAGSSQGSSATDPPTSLMAVKQFTSGRRSDAWAADLSSTIQVDPQLVH